MVTAAIAVGHQIAIAIIVPVSVLGLILFLTKWPTKHNKKLDPEMDGTAVENNVGTTLEKLQENLALLTTELKDCDSETDLPAIATKSETYERMLQELTDPEFCTMTARQQVVHRKLTKISGDLALSIFTKQRSFQGVTVFRGAGLQTT